MSPSAGRLFADAAPITGGFMSSESPVLDTLTDMTAASVDHNSLSPRDYMLARLAALIAMDAPAISYFVNAVAPVVGAPRVMSAGGHILRALGIAVAVADAELAAEVSQP